MSLFGFGDSVSGIRGHRLGFNFSSPKLWVMLLGFRMSLSPLRVRVPKGLKVLLGDIPYMMLL